MTINLVSAIAVAENVVRLVFDYPVSFTGLLNPNDAASVVCYAVTAITGRVVNAVSPALNLTVDPTGKTVDLTVDRSFSPDVSQYTIALSHIVGTDGRTLGTATLNFFGVSRRFIPPDPATAYQSRDMANPQTVAALEACTGDTDPNELGTHPVDNSGDYATDVGIDNLKKRVLRRLTTSKGAFLHAPGYGVGIPDQLKRLNIPHVRETLMADAENQIGQEPDVLQVKITDNIYPSDPSVVYFFVYVRTVQGLAVKYEVPFAIPA